MTQKIAIFGLIIFSILTSGVSYFFVDRTKADWFFTYWGIVGTNLSVLGIFYTLVQLQLLRTESQIIKNTTDQTRDKIDSMNRFADVATAMKLIQEIQGYTRARKYEPGVMRLQELKSIIGQMKSFNANLSTPLDLDSIISKLNYLINSMEKDIEAKSTSIKVAAVNASLEKIFDSLVDIQSETLQRT